MTYPPTTSRPAPPASTLLQCTPQSPASTPAILLEASACPLTGDRGPAANPQNTDSLFVKHLMFSFMKLSGYLVISSVMGWIAGAIALNVFRFPVQTLSKLASTQLPLQPLQDFTETMIWHLADPGLIVFALYILVSLVLLAPLLVAGTHFGRMCCSVLNFDKAQAPQPASLDRSLGMIHPSLSDKSGDAPKIADSWDCLVVTNCVMCALTGFKFGLFKLSVIQIDLQSVVYCFACILPHALIALPALILLASMSLALHKVVTDKSVEMTGQGRFSIAHTVVWSKTTFWIIALSLSALFIAAQIKTNLSPRISGFVNLVSASDYVAFSAAFRKSTSH